jgi:hypothetical protein
VIYLLAQEQQIFILNNVFISKHISELIELEDYVPISFEEYDAQQERDDFLKSKNLLSTIQEMDQLIRQKCQAYENPVKAWDSVLIEWVDCHPEFEGIISEVSFEDYQRMKNNNDFIDFIDLLEVEILSEEKDEPNILEYSEDFIIKDDSSIKLPDFNVMRKIYDKYPSTLLANYLSYLV